MQMKNVAERELAFKVSCKNAIKKCRQLFVSFNKTE